MVGAIPPLFLYVVMARTETSLPLSTPNDYTASHKECGTMNTITGEGVVAHFRLQSRKALQINLTAAFGQGILARHVQ